MRRFACTCRYYKHALSVEEHGIFVANLPPPPDPYWHCSVVHYIQLLIKIYFPFETPPMHKGVTNMHISSNSWYQFLYISKYIQTSKYTWKFKFYFYCELFCFKNNLSSKALSHSLTAFGVWKAAIPSISLTCNFLLIDAITALKGIINIITATPANTDGPIVK